MEKLLRKSLSDFLKIQRAIKLYHRRRLEFTILLQRCAELVKYSPTTFFGVHRIVPSYKTNGPPWRRRCYLLT